MWTKVSVLSLLLLLAGSRLRADDVEPQQAVSHLCNFENPLLDPTDTEGDGYCDCDLQNVPPWGELVVKISCRKHNLTDAFWPEDGREYLPQGTVQVDLSQNSLSRIPRLIGEALRYLLLDHNEIATVPDKVFAGLGSLLELDLSWNRLEVLGTDALTGLGLVKKIDLSHNHIAAIEVNAFSGAIHLEWLVLSNNSLGEFFNRTAETDLYLRLGVTTRLATIELERCNLIDISLTNGAGLEKAFLGHNRLQQVTRLPKQLSYLDLSGTPIRSLSPKFLPHLLHLETLVMQDMPILYTLEAYSLYGLPRLALLNLQGSRNLSVIHAHTFGVVRNETDTALKRLILKGTNIRTLNGSLAFAFENVRMLDLRGAPLRCDCQLRWLREMHNLTTVGICLKPSTLRHRPFGTIEPHQFECRAEQSWVYTVFNVILAILLVVGVGVGIYLIVRAVRPPSNVQLRKVGENSPYARVTIEPNQAENL
ncbi:leucine-rich repeat neuronal protein 3-like [Anopheles cruzii]|uniref:leucine-rich repeat neuronal protein 3-like n=1 Tax=Anopheles cruzii TaxID=68878 RepID=UPI0022EC61C3|nr:leucine-rich repeat neuronal protein 3-like [Anopheles cruzii]